MMSLRILLTAWPRWITPLAYGGPSCSTKRSRPFACSRRRAYRPSDSQRSRIAGSRLGRSPRIGKSVAGRCRVALYGLSGLLVLSALTLVAAVVVLSDARRLARTRLACMSRAEDIARLPGVAVHLRDQRRQVGEFFLVAQPGDELDLDPATVQVAVEIEQVCLQQRLHAAHRRPGPEARDRWPRRIAHAVHPGRVHARQRRA